MVSCKVRSKLNKFEHVWREEWGRGPIQMGEPGSVRGTGPCTEGEGTRAEALYFGTSCEQTDRHTTENITFPTSLAAVLTVTSKKHKIVVHNTVVYMEIRTRRPRKKESL